MKNERPTRYDGALFMVTKCLTCITGVFPHLVSLIKGVGVESKIKTIYKCPFQRDVPMNRKSATRYDGEP